MTEQEKREFERRKKDAENQLNKMYYGTSGNHQNSKGLKMPPFLNSPQQKPNQNKTSDNKTTTNDKTTTKSEKENHTTKIKKSGIDLLNLLNFKGIKMDNDRLIILALCLLLSSDEVDELLLLALMYIML